jgi:hypothetical protein
MVTGAWAAADATVEGRFIMWGRVGAVAEQVSVRWQYGLVLNVTTQDILGVCRWAYTTKSPPLSHEVEAQLDAQLAALPCG